MRPTRVLVAGAGAIGQFVGGLLHEAGHDVTLWTTPRHVEGISRNGLCVRGKSNLCWDPKVVAQLEDSGETWPFILLTAKAHMTTALSQAAAPHLEPGGTLVSLQNGFGNPQKAAAILPPASIAVATTSVGVLVEEPGKILHVGDGATHVGPWTEPEAGRRACELLDSAGLAPEWHDDMRSQVWRKGLLNAAINPVGALYGANNGRILDDPELFGLSMALLREGETLARKARVELGADGGPMLSEALVNVLAKTRDNRNSMLQDVQAHRATETEQILGRLVRLGEQLLASMPRMDFVYGRMKDLESSYLGAEAANRLAWDELQASRTPF